MAKLFNFAKNLTKFGKNGRNNPIFSIFYAYLLNLTLPKVSQCDKSSHCDCLIKIELIPNKILRYLPLDSLPKLESADITF